MRKYRLSAIVSGMAVIGVTATLTLAAVPAQATSSIPGPSQTCSSGQPKLDYQWGYLLEPGGYYFYTWSNVCGTGTWAFTGAVSGGANPTGNFLWTLRMPTSPYHRIWLHQDANGGGLSACFYSEDTDIYLDNYTGQDGGWIETPGNVQVSANTSPC
jgi:hypothetical protein